MEYGQVERWNPVIVCAKALFRDIVMSIPFIYLDPGGY